LKDLESLLKRPGYESSLFYLVDEDSDDCFWIGLYGELDCVFRFPKIGRIWGCQYEYDVGVAECGRGAQMGEVRRGVVVDIGVY
jgi:hypothetical protein